MTAEQEGPYKAEFHEVGGWFVNGPKCALSFKTQGEAETFAEKMKDAHAQGRASMVAEVAQVHQIYKNIGDILQANFEKHGIRDITKELFDAITCELLKAGEALKEKPL